MWFVFSHVEINRDHFFIIDFQGGPGKYMDAFYNCNSSLIRKGDSLPK